MDFDKILEPVREKCPMTDADYQMLISVVEVFLQMNEKEKKYTLSTMENMRKVHLFEDDII